MARLYEMCNDIDSEDILKYREEVTEEEKDRMMKNFKAEKKHSANKGNVQEGSSALQRQPPQRFLS